MRKTPISENNSLMTPFVYSGRAFARIRQTLLLKVLGGADAWAAPPTLGLRP